MPHSDFNSVGGDQTFMLDNLLGVFNGFAFVVSCARLRDTPIIYCSDGFVNLTGYSRAEIIGRNCRFLQGPDTDKTKILAIRDAVREEKPLTCVLRNYKKDGTPFLNLLHIAPIVDTSGQVAWYCGVQTEVSEETACRLTAGEGATPLQSGEHLEVYNLLPSLANIADQCLTLKSALQSSASRISMDVVRHSRESFESRASFDMGGRPFLPHHRASSASSASACGSASASDRAGPSSSSQQMLGLSAACPQGSAASFDDAARLSRDGSGVLSGHLNPLAGAVCSAETVPSPLLMQLVEIQQALCISDPKLPDCPIIHASQAFLDMTGYPADEVLGYNCRFLQGPGTDRAAVDKLRSGIAACEPVTVQLLNYKKCGEPFWNCVHVAPLRDGSGKAVLYVGVQMDVTSAVNAETQAAVAHGPGEVDFDEETMPYVHLGQMAAVGKVRMAVRGLGSRSLVRRDK
uniref:Putative LOV domain-containing protein n=1 Tax=Monomastix opisthostigma TaxID=687946 RepID=A0A126WWE9_9CHLO|nr:putative LOV domain-containing protein [Monomastix opisthostigma]